MRSHFNSSLTPIGPSSDTRAQPRKLAAAERASSLRDSICGRCLSMSRMCRTGKVTSKGDVCVWATVKWHRTQAWPDWRGQQEKRDEGREFQAGGEYCHHFQRTCRDSVGVEAGERRQHPRLMVFVAKSFSASDSASDFANSSAVAAGESGRQEWRCLTNAAFAHELRRIIPATFFQIYSPHDARPLSTIGTKKHSLSITMASSFWASVTSLPKVIVNLSCRMW